MIVRDAIEGVRTMGDGAVILLHSWPKGTGEAVGPMIVGLRDIGASFVSIGELDHLP